MNLQSTALINNTAIQRKLPLTDNISALLGTTTTPQYNGWDVTPYGDTMQAQHEHQELGYYAQSSTSSGGVGFSPFNDFVPLYADPNTPQQHQHNNNTLSQYPSSLSSTGTGNDGGLHDAQEKHESKRLRNTAASARFRAKKKRREQSLERNTREKKEKLAKLEGRIAELEAENQWLKDLIMEKNDTKEDVAKLRKRYDVVAGDRKGYERKDGVRT